MKTTLTGLLLKYCMFLSPKDVLFFVCVQPCYNAKMGENMFNFNFKKQEKIEFCQLGCHLEDPKKCIEQKGFF